MKINELIGDFTIFTSIEDRKVLEKMTHPRRLNSFSEREQHIIENLIHKGLVIKIGQHNVIVVANEI